MSENKKQTLFRFKTTRAPKTLPEQPLPFYIYHPDINKLIPESVFYAAIKAMGSDEDKMEILQTVADSFTPITLNDLINYESELYILGNFLVQNRKTITLEQFANETDPGATGVSPLSVRKYMIWDNYFYQVLTGESPQLMETLRKVLLASYVVSTKASLTSVDLIRKAIGSKIVLPKDMIGGFTTTSRATTAGLGLPETSLLLKHVTTAENQAKVAIANQALKELQHYKLKHRETNLPIETLAIQTHMNAVGQAVKNGTTTVVDDEFSGNKVKRVSASIPTYNYKAPDELTSDVFEGTTFTAPTLFLFGQLGLTESKTFKQVENGLNKYIREHQNETFRNTGFHVEKLSLNGTVMAKRSMEWRYNDKYACIVRPVIIAQDENTTKTCKMFLSVDVGSTCVQLSSIKMRFQEITWNFDTFTASNKDGILTIELSPEKPIEFNMIVVAMFQLEMKLSNGTVLTANSGVHLERFEIVPLTIGTNDHAGNEVLVPSNYGMTRLGVAEFRKVEQELCCYVPGEVSHIENIMAREYKERSTRRLRRSEDTTTTSSSTESEHQTDTSSTSRADMQQETSKVLSESRENSQDISGHFSTSKDSKFLGDLEIGSDFSGNNTSSNSQEISESQSVSFAKEITDKALDRVVSKVSEERVSRIIDEFEEQNRHGFDNRKGAEHISGVYRWVDKIYKNTVHNYGKRLQYEFMIPEPASFHIVAKTAVSDAGVETPLKKPLDPRTGSFGLLTPISHAGLITEDNYLQWAAAYGATVVAPPDAIKVIGKSVIRPQDESPWSASKVVNDTIELPEGYGIKRVYLNALGNGDNCNWERYYVSVGGTSRVYWTGVHERFLHAESTTFPEIAQFTKSVPVAVQFTGLDGGIVTFELELERNESIFADWQIETFNAIVTAYEKQLSDYKDALAETQIQKAQLLADNPAYYRRIENTILKKNCIAYLIGHMNMGKPFVTNGNLANMHVQLSAGLDRYAATVKFFEQAFEWELMEYRFYPFYWADSAKWGQMYGRENDDSLFRSFLQAGMARTIVTVRPGFEEAVMLYMSTGMIWNNGPAPLLDDPLFLSIDKELAEPEYTIEESWETRVPSTLTVIQSKTVALDASGLPCCDSNQPEPKIERPAADPLEALDVFIPGDDEPTHLVV